MLLFNNAYKGRRVLITGHTGFKGSWLFTLLQKMGAVVEGISLEPPTKPSHFEICRHELPNGPCDIRDFKEVEKRLKQFDPEIIFHLASQPLVMNSYLYPRETFEVNIIGTLNILEICKKLPSLKVLVNITSDKVYDPLIKKDKRAEEDKLGGVDPYSSSKVCVEVVLHSYIHSFFNPKYYKNDHHLLVGIPRAGNVIGGGDWAIGRIIPDIIRSVQMDSSLLIRNPESIRPWQHVLDCLSGYLLLGQYLLEEQEEKSGIYNFGPVDDNFCTVNDIVKIAKEYWDDLQIVSDTNPQLYETEVLKLDCSKAMEILHWRPVWNSEKSIRKSFEWYYNFIKHGKVNTYSDIEEYFSDATGVCVWAKP